MPACAEREQKEEKSTSSGEMGSDEQHTQEDESSFKLHSYKDQSLESKTKEGFQLIRQIYEAQAPIAEELEETKMERDKLISALKYHRYRYQCEWGHISWKRRHQYRFQETSSSPCSYDRLRRGMIHMRGAPTLAKERKIFRELDQLQPEDVVNRIEEETEIVTPQGSGRRSIKDRKRIKRRKDEERSAKAKKLAEQDSNTKKDYDRLLADKSKVNGHLLRLRVKMDGLNREKAMTYQRILDAHKLIDATKAVVPGS